MNKFLFAALIILPNIMIKVAELGMSFFTAGTILGTILFVYAFTIIASQFTKWMMKYSPQLTRDMINIAAGYVIYYAITFST